MIKDFIAVVSWDGEKELVQCDAETVSKARIKLKVVLDRDYKPGWKILSIEENYGPFYIWSYT